MCREGVGKRGGWGWEEGRIGEERRGGEKGRGKGEEEGSLERGERVRKKGGRGEEVNR